MNSRIRCLFSFFLIITMIAAAGCDYIALRALKTQLAKLEGVAISLNERSAQIHLSPALISLTDFQELPLLAQRTIVTGDQKTLFYNFYRVSSGAPQYAFTIRVGFVADRLTEIHLPASAVAWLPTTDLRPYLQAIGQGAVYSIKGQISGKLRPSSPQPIADKLSRIKPDSEEEKGRLVTRVFNVADAPSGGNAFRFMATYDVFLKSVVSLDVNNAKFSMRFTPASILISKNP
jgi:hypothetical protein